MFGDEIKICEGSDSVVLLIHGILSGPQYFRRFLSAIPEGWSVYNILLDGHGGTVKDFSYTSMEKWKRQVDTRVAELCASYDRVVVIAHSMGTLLTIEAAPRYPQVKAMLLLDTPLKVWVRPTMMVRALKIAFGSIREEDPVEAATRDSVSVALTRRLWQYLGWVPRFWELLCLCRETRSKISQISVPCYAFHSREDELVSPKSARYFRHNPLICHEMLEASGHFYFPDEDMERIMKAIMCLFNDNSL